jgi:hypothetical protein
MDVVPALVELETTVDTPEPTVKMKNAVTD